MHAETLAPHRRISSQAISLEKASAILDKYLTDSTVHAHLHPDALITPSGTDFSAQSGPTGGVVLHNLHRVAAGLKGDYLEPEPTPEPEGANQARDSSALNGVNGQAKEAAAVTEEWQEMSEFEREEGMVEVGEVGNRSNFVQEGGEAPELETSVGAAGEGKKKRRKDEEDKLDKAARKKAKKAKDKEFRAQKEKARAEQSA
ncbi:hypothetical protein BU23DRAFT_180289 [Bimuria novae-zelandiae CBS 107.79]|uniref:Uncharacterized protein n=1 Tax=Bimuria novae-zelandiae CBS 107.79 TaxID=1447943 RepID=A0A6A5V2N1_9PLEO|nr:hypothetical protein BU23DRAFT_180289 [Bimuria novae-zelandiae CBS 107.79]